MQYIHRKKLKQRFYKVQAILDGRNVIKIPLARRNSSNPDFPLRRVIKCDKCGMGLTGGWSKGRHTRYAYYRCAGKCVTTSIKIDELEVSLISLLKEITPSKECTDLFVAFLYKTYHERLGRIQKIRNEADSEIEKIKEIRRMLVRKNLEGVYSDEVFKEQTAMLEEKMFKVQVGKEDATIDKYNIDEVTSFIKTLLADLGEAYKRSSLSQIKVLLGSIFPDGLAWNYNGGLNHTISPLYQAIRAFNEGTASYSGHYTPWVEPSFR